MSKGQRIPITVEFLATIKGMDEVVGKIQNGMKNSNFDFLKNLKAAKLFDNYKNEYKNFQGYIKDNSINPLEAKDAIKSGNNIIKMFRDIKLQYGDLSNVSMEMAKKFFPEAFSVDIEKAQKYIKDLEADVEKLSKKKIDILGAQTGLEKAKKKLEDIKAIKIASDFSKPIEDANNELEETKKKLTDLRNNSKKLSEAKGNTKAAKGALTTAKTNYTKTKNRFDAAEKGSPEAKALKQQLDERQKIREEADAKYNATLNKQKTIEDNLEKGNIGNLTSEEQAKAKELTTSIREQEAAVRKLNDAKDNAPQTEEAKQKLIDDQTTAYDNQLQKVNQLKTEIEKLSTNTGNLEGIKKSLSDFGIDASNIQNLEDAKEVLKELENADTVALDEIRKNFVNMGVSADQAENLIEEMRAGLKGVASTSKDLDNAAKEVEQLRNQVLQFFSIGNAIQLFKRAVGSAFATVKELDKTMTETAVVTEFNVGDMWSQLPQYTQRANELGVSIKSAYEAATLYYQQGLKTNEVIGVSNETLKMARIAGMEAVDATNLMTAALRGFNMEVNEMSAQKVNDVYSELAAITAADTREIGVAMSKTASIAASANMEFNTTAALLSQIIETTREAPETAGTAMKTIIARFTEVKKLISEGQLTGSDEEGEVIDVNKLDTALKTVGISLKGFLQGTEGIDDIFLQLAEKWDGLDISTQRYIATMAAGSRQQSRFLAMMGDYDRTMELVSAANNSAGASQKQFEKTLDSMESKLATLKNAWDEFVMGLANQEVLKAGVQALTGLLNAVNNILKLFSGGQPIVKTFLTALTAVGAFKIGKSILGGKGVLGKLFGKDTVKEAKTAGGKVGKSFFGSIKTNIQEKDGKEIWKTVKGLFSDYNINDEIFGNLGDDQKTGVQDALKNRLSEIAKENQKVNSSFNEIAGDIDTGKIDQAIIKTEKCGSTLKLTAQESEKFGLKLSKSFDMAATGAQVAGGIFLGLASVLENMGMNEGVVDFFRVLGTTMMGAGVAMSMLGNVFTAAGGKMVIAGISAQATWWWLLGIVAAIAVVTAAFVAMGRAAHKASLEGQIEDAKKATEDAKTAAEKAKAAYSEFLSETEEYNGLRETLENLTRGTQEWRDALAEVNQKVLDLLTNYPELAQYLSRGEDGQLVIDQEGIDNKNQKSLRAVQNTASNIALSEMRELKLYAANAEREIKLRFESLWGEYDPSNMLLDHHKDDFGLNFLYEKGTMDALRKAMETDPADLLSVGQEGEMSLALQSIAEGSEYTAEQLYDLAIALNAYDNALISSQKKIKGQAEAAVMSGMSNESLEYKYSDNLVKTFAKQFSDPNYEKREEEYISKIYYRDGESENRYNQVFQELAKEYEVQDKMQNDDLQDLKTLYAAMAGILTEDIPEKLTNSKVELQKAIGEMAFADQIRKNVEEFRLRMEDLSEQDQKSLAGLLTKDGSQFTMSEIDQVLPLNEYAQKLGYSVQELGAVLGYTEKAFTDLPIEMQSALRAEDPIKVAHWESGEIVPVAEQMQFDSDQAKVEMGLAFDEVISFLRTKTGRSESVLKDYLGGASVGAIENIVKQIDSMGLVESTEYVFAFSNALNSLKAEDKDSLQNYLPAIDLSDMTDIIEAKEYMQELGIDPKVVQRFWLAAVRGSGAYVSSMSQALQLTNRMQQKMTATNDLSSRMAEGTGTYDDVLELTKAGADISQFQLTSEGWKATSGEIEKAIGLMRSYYIEQATEVAKQNRAELDRAQDVQRQRSYGLGNITQYDGKTKTYKQTKRRDGKNTLTQMTTDQIESQLEVSAEDYGGRGGPGYWEAVEAAYASYLEHLNNGEEIQIVLEKQRAYLEASEFTADENALQGGSDESVRYSMQYEATQAGFDPSEVTNYANQLMESYKLEQQMADRIAIDNSLMRQGIEELSSSWEELTANLASADAGVRGLAINDLRGKIQKILGTAEDLSDEWLTNANNLKLMERAAKGNAEAIDDLRKSATEDIILQLGLSEDTEQELTGLINDFVNSAEYDDLEIGAQLNDTDMVNGLNELLRSGSLTVEQMNSILEGIGWEPEITYAEMPLSEVSRFTGKQTNEVLVPDGSGGYKKQTLTQEQTGGMTGSQMVRVPILGSQATKAQSLGYSTGITASYKGPGATISSKGSSGGGGGGGGEKETWENPYDELYNLTEQVNESLRQREKLEREYDRILDNRKATTKQITANALKQIAKLREEIALQKQLQAGRKKQINQLGSETFKDDKGKEKTFSQWGVTKYASYDEKTGTIKIDWAAIDKVKDPETGAAIEAYISKLEELSQQFEDTQDTIEDMEDLIREIQERGKAEYVEFEERIYDALVDRDQKVIDNYQELSDTISKSNIDILDSLQESIDLERQIRDNTKTEEDIAEKEARLAYLRRDTSGANALEIKQLEEELKDAQEAYGDTLVDQEIQRLTKVNEEAIEQRERQIEIMQSQLDYAAESGQYWAEVSELLSSAFNADGSLNNNSALVNLLKETEGFKALSEFGGMQWIDQLIESWLSAQDGLANWKVDKAKQDKNGAQTTNAGKLVYNSKKDVWEDGKGGPYLDVAYNTTTGQYTASGYAAPAPPPAPAPQPAPAPAPAPQEETYTVKKGDTLSRIARKYNDKGYNTSTNKIAKDNSIKKENLIRVGQKLKIKHYKQGGMIDFTGPAWLDGSKSKPESMLDAIDTKNFIQLKEILAEILKGTSISGGSGSGGDNYFDINIEVDSLSNDYDVEKLATKVKDIINSDARYRNVNSINFLR